MLAALSIGTPHAIKWFSDTVQAEFVGPDAPVTPTQFASAGRGNVGKDLANSKID
jgi:hypothetical protein